MKSLIVTFLSFLYIPFIYSQESFSSSIHTGIGEIGLRVLELDEKIFVMSGAICSNDKSCAVFSRIDKGGQPETITQYDWLHPGARMTFQHQTNGFFVTGFTNNDTTRDLIKLEFSPTLDSTNTVEKSIALNDYPLASYYLDEHYYVLTFMEDTPSSDQIIISKLSEDFQLVDSIIIGKEFNNPFPYAIKPSIDSNLIMSISYVDFTNPSERTYALYKFSPDLEILWKYNDGATSLPEQTYGTALLNGGYAMTSTLDSFTQTEHRFRPRITFLDSLGKKVNHIDMLTEFIIEPNIGNIITAKNGDIIGIGYKDNHFVENDVSFSGWVFRISQEGELIWERNIIDRNIEPPDGYNQSGIFTNLTEMDDGSILVVGQIRDRFEDGSLNPNVWLLKLDENGCFFPDCGEDQFLTTSSPELNPVIQNVLLFPNPVQDVINIQFNEAVSLDRILFYDYMGRFVKSKEFQLIGVDFTVPVHNLESGIYFVQLWTESGLVVRKVFVE